MFRDARPVTWQRNVEVRIKLDAMLMSSASQPRENPGLCHQLFANRSTPEHPHAVSSSAPPSQSPSLRVQNHLPKLLENNTHELPDQHQELSNLSRDTTTQPSPLSRPDKSF